MAVVQHPEVDTGNFVSEVILLVDCSGSMAGSRIHQSREAARCLVKELPEEFLFSIHYKDRLQALCLQDNIFISLERLIKRCFHTARNCHPKTRKKRLNM
jgi:hypothetical protein